MKVTLGAALGAATVIVVWTFWRPALRWALSRGDEPYHP